MRISIRLLAAGLLTLGYANLSTAQDLKIHEVSWTFVPDCDPGLGYGVDVLVDARGPSPGDIIISGTVEGCTPDLGPFMKSSVACNNTTRFAGLATADERDGDQMDMVEFMIEPCENGSQTYEGTGGTGGTAGGAGTGGTAGGAGTGGSAGGAGSGGSAGSAGSGGSAGGAGSGGSAGGAGSGGSAGGAGSGGSAGGAGSGGTAGGAGSGGSAGSAGSGGSAGGAGSGGSAGGAGSGGSAGGAGSGGTAGGDSQAGCACTIQSSKLDYSTVGLSLLLVGVLVARRLRKRRR